MFYFTSFYGDQKSLLYSFYLTAYKVLLASYSTIETDRSFPVAYHQKEQVIIMAARLCGPILPVYESKVYNKTMYGPIHLLIRDKSDFLPEYRSHILNQSGMKVQGPLYCLIII